ncbi:retrotransposon protein, putative, ty1-copia subclass [Tanacetum coccineum]
MVVVMDRNILRMERRITPNKINTTSRKSFIVGSVGNLGIKLRIIAVRKNMEAEILEETSIKQTIWNLQKSLLESLLIGGLTQVPQSTSVIQEGCLYLTKSKFCYVYLTNTKDEALNMFKTYKAEVENQLDKKIKLLWSDREGEYESNDFAKFCSTFEDITNNTIIESAKAEFFKNTFPYKDKDKQISNPKKRVLDDELSQDQKDNTCEVPQENAKPKEYLKHTMTHELHYTKYPPVLEGFCDANWIFNHNEGKSISGYVFTLGGVAVSWKSSKQNVNTRSTMEAEFVFRQSH